MQPTYGGIYTFIFIRSIYIFTLSCFKDTIKSYFILKFSLDILQLILLYQQHPFF